MQYIDIHNLNIYIYYIYTYLLHKLVYNSETMAFLEGSIFPVLKKRNATERHVVSLSRRLGLDSPFGSTLTPLIDRNGCFQKWGVPQNG